MSKLLERKFSKPTQISKHLYCSICADVFIDPQRVQCGHTYCKLCLESWSKNNNSCPECRAVINSQYSGKDLIAEKIIQDLEVFCINKLCEWKGKLSDLQKHVRYCQMAKPPEWLLQFQFTGSFEDPNEPKDLALVGNEEYEERVNEEVSKKSLAERLFTKSQESRDLLTSVFQPEAPKPTGKGRGGRKKKEATKTEPIGKSSSMDFYDSFLATLDSDNEVEEIKKEENTQVSELLNSNSKSQSEGKTSLKSFETLSTKVDESELETPATSDLGSKRKTRARKAPHDGGRVSQDNARKTKAQ